MVRRGGVSLSLGLGAWAGSLELPCALRPAVPGNERSVPGTLTVTVFTVYGRLSHFGRACDSVERSVVRENFEQPRAQFALPLFRFAGRDVRLSEVSGAFLEFFWLCLIGEGLQQFGEGCDRRHVRVS